MIGRPAWKPSALPPHRRLLVGAACACLLVGWSLVAAATELGPPRHTIHDDGPEPPAPPDEAPLVDVPDLVPTAFPAFSDEVFRFPGWGRTPKVPPVDARTVSRYSGERKSALDYSFTVLPTSGKFRQVFLLDTGLDSTLPYTFEELLSGQECYMTLPGPRGAILSYGLDAPTVEHRLSVGGRDGRGPRWEFTISEAIKGRGDSAMGTPENVYIAGPADSNLGHVYERADVADGSQRRLALTASWALPARMAGERVETLRVYAGWAVARYRYTLYNQWGLLSPLGTALGPYSTDRFDAAGPVIGMASTWKLAPRTELFFEGAYQRTKGGFSRTYDSFPWFEVPRLEIDNEGLGWDGRLGVRLNRGRLFWEAALAASRVFHRGGHGSLVFPAGTAPSVVHEPMTASGESDAETYNLTFTAGWRF